LDIYVAIKAFGSESGFDGKLEQAKIGSVNNLPDPPDISADGNTVKGNTSVNFTVTKGRDKDSQDTYIDYKINDGPR
jgi:hypothetical protein